MPSRPQPRAENTAADRENSKPGEKADPAPAPRRAVAAPQVSEDSGRLTVAAPAQTSTGTAPRRSAESALEPEAVAQPEAKPVVHSQPTRQISLRLAGAGSATVDVQVRERAGKVQVAVRTPDARLAQTLQSDLGDLVDRLEGKGFKTEAWVPAAVHPTSSAAGSASEGGAEQDRQHQPGAWSGNGEHGQQQESNQRHEPRWKTRFEETLAGLEEARTDNR
jgi:hypothetical protein